RSEEHTSELQSHLNLVCRLLLEKMRVPRSGSPREPACDCRFSSRKLIGNKGKILCSRVLIFFNDTATTEIYTLSLHDALPICVDKEVQHLERRLGAGPDLLFV